MRQILYISTIARDAAGELDHIVETSRRNNAKGGVTGLLFFDGKRFLQALEGEAAIVAATFARIAADPRHRGLVILSDREIEAREFGDWAMAYDPTGGDRVAAITRIGTLAANAAPAVRATFDGFARVRRAA